MADTNLIALLLNARQTKDWRYVDKALDLLGVYQHKQAKPESSSSIEKPKRGRPKKAKSPVPNEAPNRFKDDLTECVEDVEIDKKLNPAGTLTPRVRLGPQFVRARCKICSRVEDNVNVKLVQRIADEGDEEGAAVYTCNGCACRRGSR